MTQIITAQFNTHGMKPCNNCDVWNRSEDMGTCGIASCEHYGLRLCVECLMHGTEVELTDLVCTEHYLIGKKLMLKRLDRVEIL